MTLSWSQNARSRVNTHATRASWVAPWMMALCVTAAALLTAGQAEAVETSCDVTTGASCLWGRGCDCDHDGFVRESGKAKKYCHFTKCPIDKNDNDPNQLGKVSQYNADGDGWTTQFDCDDKDPCVGKICGQSTCKVVVDKDKDGVPAEKDCDDNDPNVKPGAPIACCNCDIIGDPAKKKAFGCSSGCPLSNPPPDTSGGADTQTSPADTQTSPADTMTSKADTTAPKADTTSGKPDSSAASADSAAIKADTGSAQPIDTASGTTADDGAASGGAGAGKDADRLGGGNTDGLTWDSGRKNGKSLVGGGTLSRPTPPAPGCSAAPTGRPGALGGLLLLLPLALGRAVRRRRTQAVASVVAVAVASGLLGGCAMVKPWKRELLAKRPMIIGENSGETQLEQHTFQYREGAAGGFGGGGGGCGCN